MSILAGLERGVLMPECEERRGGVAFAGLGVHNWPSRAAAAHTSCRRSAGSCATCLAEAAPDRQNTGYGRRWG